MNTPAILLHAIALNAKPGQPQPSITPISARFMKSTSVTATGSSRWNCFRSEYSRDPVACHRFEREARAASALNHPNICTLHEIDECDGYRFMAMELLQGATLRDRIAGEPMRRDQLLDFAIQIVSGLEAAHSAEIIHRDIKPANIFVTE